MFTMASCPYCQEARRWMEELMAEHPEYRNVEMEIIDEVEFPEIANRYDYYYVPTYFADNIKLHEGAATKAKVQAVYAHALTDG